MTLVEEHFPSYMSIFTNPDEPSFLKSRMARYMYLYVHGGIYTDLDVMSLRPIDPLLRNCGGFVALLSDDLTFPQNVPDALLASTPGHPLWLDALQALRAASRRARRAAADGVDGSVVLKAAVSRYLKAQGASLWSQPARPRSLGLIKQYASDRVLAVRAPGLCVAPGGAAYPYDWHLAPGERLDPERERQLAQACSVSSTKFSQDECTYLLGIASAAAYTIAFWEHVPEAHLRALRQPRRGSGVWRGLAVVAVVALAVVAAAWWQGAGGGGGGGAGGAAAGLGSGKKQDDEPLEKPEQQDDKQQRRRRQVWEGQPAEARDELA